MDLISSKDNPEIKHLKKLIDDKDFRYGVHEYIVEGLFALKDVKQAKKLFVREGSLPAEVKAGKVFTVSKQLFDRLSPLENNQGVIGICELILKDPGDIDSNSRYVFLDRLQDPGNMGTIIRTAAAFGMKGIIFLKGTVDPFSPKVVRAAAGSLAKLDVIMARDYLYLRPFNIVAADAGGENLFGFKWPKNFILAIGNEGSGLSEEVLSCSKARVSIPMPGGTESLNAAVSAGIILYSSIQKC